MLLFGVMTIRPALLMEFLNTAEKRDRRMIHLPMGRFGEAIEIAKAALFCTCSSPLFPLFHSDAKYLY